MDIFGNIKLELSFKWSMPNLEVETRWSSTFITVNRVYCAWSVLNGVSNKVKETNEMIVKGCVWEAAQQVWDFLKLSFASRKASQAQHM